MITPVLLAAGASTRMGRPKALLDFDGETALERLLDAFAGLARPVVVTGKSSLPTGRARVVPNPEPERGQTSSLKAGLRSVPPDAAGFLFHPVDFPLLSRSDVDRLVAAFLDPRYAAKSIFIPSFGLRRGHPVLCRREMAREFLALPDGVPARVAVNRRPERILHLPFRCLLSKTRDSCLRNYRRRERISCGK